MPTARRSLKETNEDAAAALERVVVGNDLSRLTPSERVAYYKRLCEGLGLNPYTRPFQYLTLSGKLTLYATKDCTEQLRVLRGVSITKLEPHTTDEETYTVTVYGRDRSGREDVATGVVGIGRLAGEARANAMMKAETKAKRRLTLSLCGLGILDESEIEGVVIGEPVKVDLATGEIETPLDRDALAESEPAPPPDVPNPEDERILNRIREGFAHLSIPLEEQRSLWGQFLPDADAFLALPARRVALEALLQHLRARSRDTARSSRTETPP